MALTVTKNDLKRHIGRKLGYSRTVSAIDANSVWLLDVNDVLDNALRRFYENEQQHEWSFLKPIKPFQFVEGQYAYSLPPEFSMLDGPITYAIGADTVYPPIEIVGAHQVMHRLQQDDSTSGRPRIAGLRVTAPDQVGATRHELVVYPTSDDDYDVLIPMKVNPFSLDYATALPLGGQPHAQTLIAACFAECEAIMDEASDGRHEERFQRMLAASIAHDQKLSCPDTLGYNPDRSDGFNDYDPYMRRALGMNSGLVSYNGVVPE